MPGADTPFSSSAQPWRARDGPPTLRDLYVSLTMLVVGALLWGSYAAA